MFRFLVIIPHVESFATSPSSYLGNLDESGKEDKADDSHGEDDAGEAWRLQGGPYHPPFWQCHVTRKPGQVLCVEVLRQWLSSTTPASCLGNLDGGP